MVDLAQSYSQATLFMTLTT
ncbi:hypothetical protein KSS87_013516 [Heliosperma pusillum]|nr:hypothetical protein KSS87_013516 [Heliosperma pusillum]